MVVFIIFPSSLRSLRENVKYDFGKENYGFLSRGTNFLTEYSLNFAEWSAKRGIRKIRTIKSASEYYGGRGVPAAYKPVALVDWVRLPATALADGLKTWRTENDK